MQLLDLPLELVRLVVQQMRCDLADNSGWLALSLSNKLLSVLANEELYFRPWLLHGYPGLDQVRFARLLRTLIENQSLGSLVRDLNCDGLGVFRTESTTMQPDAMEVLDMDMVVSAIHETGVSFADPWADMAREGDTDAFLTLMLVLFPRLKKLRIYLDFDVGISTTILGTTLLEGLEPQPGNTWVEAPLSSLEDVTALLYHDKNRERALSNTDMATLLLFLPKIHTLRLGLENPEEIPWPRPPRDRLPSPSLRVLDIAGLQVSHASFGILACPAVENLGWSLCRWNCTLAENQAHDRVDIDLDSISNTLAGTSTRLTELRLDLWDCYWPIGRGSHSISSLFCLKTMTVEFFLLTNCRTEPIWATKTEPYFPESLEVLTIVTTKDQHADTREPPRIVMETEMIMRHLHNFTAGLRELHLGSMMYMWFFRAELETRGQIQGVPVIMGPEPEGYLTESYFEDAWRPPRVPSGWRWLAPSTQKFNRVCRYADVYEERE